MKERYRHIFFDLDRTLWDFDKNSTTVLGELFSDFRLSELGITSQDEFIAQYLAINEALWVAYRKGEIMKRQLRKQRFTESLSRFNITDNSLGEKLDRAYLSRCPVQTALLPHAIELLQHLVDRYTLHIVTNGFTEVQYLKLKSAGLRKFFKVVLTSEKARTRKPDPEMFHLAMRLAKAEPSESLMIGDDLEIDILGARNAGMDQVYYNPAGIEHKEDLTMEVKSHAELMALL